jgi:hypothetical protein
MAFVGVGAALGRLHVFQHMPDTPEIVAQAWHQGAEHTVQRGEIEGRRVTNLSARGIARNEELLPQDDGVADGACLIVDKIVVVAAD